SFRSIGEPITLTVNDGGELITPGAADPGVTLNSSLTILNAAGNFVASAPLSSSTLTETFTGALTPGTYFAQIASFGGYTSSYDLTASYYDMGSYFLTGSGFSPAAVPEPAARIVIILMAPLLWGRRRRAAVSH